jgi:hypothetical protein
MTVFINMFVRNLQPSQTVTKNMTQCCGASGQRSVQNCLKCPVLPWLQVAAGDCKKCDTPVVKGGCACDKNCDCIRKGGF